MANGKDFENLAESRLKTVDILINNQEWGVAVYLMGFVLEYILKAAVCKALNLTSYPEVKKTKNDKIINCFLTHDFDMLVMISGASSVFNLSGQGASSWSGFTQEYTKSGRWTDMRYEVINQFDGPKTKILYDYLTKSPDGIIPLIKSQKIWLMN